LGTVQKASAEDQFDR